MKNYYDNIFKNGILMADMKILKYLNNAYEYCEFPWQVTMFVENPHESILRLKQNGIISDDNSLNISNMTTSELKDILKKNNLKVGGKKDELLNRIFANLNILELNIPNRKLYITEKGKAYQSDFRERLDNDELELFKRFFELCKSKDYDSFHKEICTYYLSIPNPPGLNADWNRHLKEGISKNEELIITNIGDDVKDEIRICTIVAYFSGNSIRHIASLYQKAYGIEMEDNMVALRTLNSVISNLREIEDYKQCGIIKYRYICANDDKVCPLCSKMNNRTFLVKDAVIRKNLPPLHDGCRCTTVSKT